MEVFSPKDAVLTGYHLFFFNYLTFSLVKLIQKYFPILNTSQTNRNISGICKLINHEYLTCMHLSFADYHDTENSFNILQEPDRKRSFKIVYKEILLCLQKYRSKQVI